MDFEGIGRVATNTTLAACAGDLKQAVLVLNGMTSMRQRAEERDLRDVPVVDLHLPAGTATLFEQRIATEMRQQPQLNL